ncbi:diguanylate cyclase domain-containing protein [Cyanobacterium sp. DS4]|uniref:diguanylate cyclase domain-containing protein n=1 Tax=Cyanobacterium sp. DS4 TaxID=2878255 RepID=UPI002E80C372|nr:diguanylate cyclase [Cyanobacterium sp. Dongsha4]WVL02125.1 diguanylate cyclase [Cyanobacterium sp. Dongsha4]
MSYYVFNSTLPIVRTEVDCFVRKLPLNHLCQKALLTPYFRQKLITRILNSIPNNHILIDQCHPFIDSDFFYIELATEKKLINEKIKQYFPEIMKEYHEFINDPCEFMGEQKKDKVENLSWWLRFETTHPISTYYFGPFESFAEAAENSQGYLENLINENAQEIAYDIEFTNPQNLTMINDIDDLQKENEFMFKELWEKEIENKYYQNLFFNSPDIRFILNDDFQIQAVNNRGLKKFNISLDKLENSYFTSLIVPNDVEKFLTLTQKLREENTEQIDSFFSLKLSSSFNQSSVDVSVNISKILDSDNHIDGWDLSFHDITDVQKNMDYLYYQSRYDCLTNLPNRLSLLEFLENILKEAEKNHSNKFAVLYLDIDKFKLINDTFGHQVGDEVLVFFAKRLVTCVRNFDHVARLSGDEFMIVLSHIHSVQEATECANRIQQVLSTCFKINEVKVKVKVSIGIVIGDIKSSKVSDLLSRADMAMYKAKFSDQLFSIYHC